MNYLKEYIHRGLVFSGFGPIVFGIIIYILSKTVDNFSINGTGIILGIISTYIIAFVQAGSSVFYIIKSWTLLKSIFVQFISLFIVYLGSYLINSWIPFDIKVIMIFCAIFVISYIIIVLIVYITNKVISNKLNKVIK